MPRPARQVDRALLRSGRALYPQRGCAGLTVRAVAEHAGVPAGMFHYHFESKDAFLRALLQELYESMYSALQAEVAAQAPALDRLRASLQAMGAFLREHGQVIGRVYLDAAQGEAVAVAFLKANLPRHLRLLLALLREAEGENGWPPVPPLRRLSFVAGAVVAPLLLAPRLSALAGAPGIGAAAVRDEVLSEAALSWRIELALQAMAGATAGSGAPPARRPR